MKKLIFTLLTGISFVLGYSQITITQQPDQAGQPKACEGTDVNLSVATSAAAGLTYQWEVQFNTLITTWTDITADKLAELSLFPGFSAIQIVNYTTNTVTIKNVSHLVDSLQIRCRIVQASTHDTAYTTAPFIKIYSTPGIDKIASVLKGCDPTDIKIKLDGTYTPLQLTTCRYQLTQNGIPVDSIDSANPLTMPSQFASQPDSITQYILIATNKTDATCIKKDTINVAVQKVFQSEKIGLVTYDLATSKWKVLWNKTINVGTDSCRIIQVQGGITKLAGAISYTSPYGIFTDSNTVVNEQPAYIIRVVDTCGHISGFSPIHKPIYLTVDTTNSTVKFTWRPYSGIAFAKHYIHVSSIRDSVYSAKNIIDSVAGTDTTYILKNPVKNSYYAISIKLSAPLTLTSVLKAESGPYNQSLSNIAEYQTQDLALKETNINTISVSPNPFADELNVNVSLQKPGSVIIELVNIIGTKIIEKNLGVQDAGNHLFTLPVDDNVAKGLYFIKVSVNGDSKIVKAVHMK